MAGRRGAAHRTDSDRLRHRLALAADRRKCSTTGPLCDALRQARRTLNYSYPKVEVATSPSVSSPMALGILRPIIVFPTDLVEKLSVRR